MTVPITPWQYVTRLAAQHKMPHALLLQGLKGLGKTAFAERLAQYLLCEGVTADQQSCGVCNNCLLVQAHTHPDLILVQPQADSNTIKIDQVRQLIELMYHKSHAGKYKIAIISPAEALNLAATNALLKLVEEPAPQVIILLIANHLQWLPATLRSRCQTIYFPPPSSEYGALPTAEAAIAVRLKWYDMLVPLLSQRQTPIVAAQIFKDTDFNDTLDILLTCIADMITLTVAKTPVAELLINRDKLSQLQQAITYFDSLKLYAIYDKLLTMKTNIKLSLNMNQPLWLEELLIFMQVPSLLVGEG